MVKLRSRNKATRARDLSGRLAPKGRKLLAIAAMPVIAASVFLAAPTSARAMVRPDQSSVYGLVNYILGPNSTPECMATSGGGEDVDAIVYRCKGTPDQQWEFQAEPTRVYNGITYMYLTNNNGSCLGTSHGDVTQGTTLVAWKCNGASNQFWEPITGSKICDPYAAIQNYGAATDGHTYVAGVSGGDINVQDNTPLVLWNWQQTCNNQDWNFVLNNERG
jgi:Ricin-type beta-trefoil lectin domain